MKKAKKLLTILVGTILGILLIFSLLGARLAYGPMSAHFLTNTLKGPIERAFLDLDIEFQETLINWNKKSKTLELQLGDLTVKSKDATLDAAFPFVGITFSREALYKAEFYPSRIEFIGPDVTVDWAASDFDEKIKKTFTKTEEEKVISGTGLSIPEEQNSGVIKILDRLLKSPDKQGVFGYLLRVGLREGNLTLIENATQTKWSSTDASVSFNRAGEGFDLSFALTLMTQNQSAELRGITNTGLNGEKSLSISLQDLNIASLAKSVNLPLDFQILDIPLYGEMNLLFLDEKLKEADFDISSGSGQIVLPSIFPTPPDIDGIEVKGFLNFSDKIIEFSDLNLDLSGAFLKGDGLIEFGNEAGPEFEFILDLENMKVRNLLKYWPPLMAKGGYAWINENIPEGVITNAKFVIDVDPDDLKIAPLPEKSFRADFQFSDVAANYLNPMPILERGSGYGYVTANYLEVNIEKGRSFDIDFEGSIFKIENMASKEKRLGLAHLNTNGRIRKILQFIDHQPLGFSTKFGIDPMETLGDISIVTELDFPIVKGTTLKDVNINAEAKLTNISMPNLVSNGGLQNTNLDMTITREGLTASGDIVLKGAPFELYWTEVFTPMIENELPSTYDLRGVLNKEQLVNFGIPIEDIMSGTVRTRMVVEGRGPNLIKGRAETDLFSGGFKSVLLGWEKKINSPGRVLFDLEWTDNEFKLNNFVADTVGLYTKGNVIFDQKTSELIEGQFTEFKTLENDLSFMAKGSFEKGFDLVVDGSELGIGPLLETLSTGKGPSKMPSLTLLLRSNKALGLNGVSISGLQLSAHNSGDFWEWVDVSGKMDEGSDFDLKLKQSDGNAGRDLSLKSNNAGKLALAAGLFINGEGGEVNLSAHLNDKYQEALIEGTLLINDFKLVKSSALVEALAAAKGKGVDSLIGENGLSFSELDMPFVLKDGIIDITDAGAHGPSIGFTMQGQVDQSMKEIHVNGVILPVYALNSLLGSIPIVGKILTGGDGGLFGVNYRIEGTTIDPKVSVNALSAFAPGFLRKIFQGKKGKLAPNQIKEIEKEQNPEPQEGPSN